MASSLHNGLAGLALALCCAAPAAADTLVDHVDGFTLDDQGHVERLTGVLIGSDGRILRVIHQGEIRPDRVDYLVDGKGQVMMPGLIDAHARVIDMGLAELTLDLSSARSLAEAQGRVAAFAAAHPDRPWIIGRGWNAAAWAGAKTPTTVDLDAAHASRPVWLVAANGHLGWANSAALAAAKVSLASKDPPGGRIERLPGTLKPSGIMLDSAMQLVESAMPAPRPVDRDLALATAQQALLRRGVTAVTDMGTTIENWQALRRAGDAGTLRLRVMAYADGIEAMALIAGSQPGPWLYDDRLRLGGVTFTMDGALATRGARLKQAYADAPKNLGPNNVGLWRLGADSRLRNLMSRAAMDGFQVAVQAAGDAATAAALDAIGELAPTYGGDRRWRIEQAQVIDQADLVRFGQHGTVVSMQPLAVAADRALIEARLGNGRLAGVDAWKSLSAAGAHLAFGSGAPDLPANPFAGLAAAITRQGDDGTPFGGWQPQERLTREAALAAWTTGAAWAGFAENRIGRLAPGLRADFLLLDRDPLLASPAELRATQVLETWVNGRQVYAAKAVPATER